MRKNENIVLMVDKETKNFLSKNDRFTKYESHIVNSGSGSIMVTISAFDQPVYPNINFNQLTSTM